ncbi:SRPBCC family protein [Histidinibacterium aquaticum]|nr:SRPBCC family protein [Histidinibacterium aquaticum]
MNTFDIDRKAPASASATVLIRAPIDEVWNRLTDISGWPFWNKAISRVRIDGPAKYGAEFTWSTGGLRIQSTIQRFDPPYVLGWSGRAPLIKARHVYWLADLGAMTSVKTEESFSGPLATVSPRWTKSIIQRSLHQGLAALKAACETARGGRFEASQLSA